MAAVQLAAEGCQVEGEEGSTGAGVNAASNRARCMRNKRTINNALVRGSVEGEVGDAGALSCTVIEGAGMIYGSAVNHTRVSRSVEVVMRFTNTLVYCARYCSSGGMTNS